MADDVIYAVAIRDDVGLWLLCRIRRSSRGDVYVLFPRDEPGWDPHASYHRDGTRHVRSHGGRYLTEQRQRPDASFRGTESVFALAIQPGEPAMFKTPCDAAKFADVLAIPRQDLPLDEHHTLAVDLVEPGNDASPLPWRAMVLQRSFRDTVPWILVTLGRGIS